MEQYLVQDNMKRNMGWTRIYWTGTLDYNYTKISFVSGVEMAMYKVKTDVPISLITMSEASLYFSNDVTCEKERQHPVMYIKIVRTLSVLFICPLIRMMDKGRMQG